jgi:hypothetical protein
MDNVILVSFQEEHGLLDLMLLILYKQQLEANVLLEHIA